MDIISFNINGLRAILKKGFVEWIKTQKPDILCLQEIKANKSQIDSDDFLNLEGYNYYWNSAERKGYSGVLILSKEKPESADFGIGIEKFDNEGRLIRLKYSNFTLFNVYFPNGKSSDERLLFKLDYYDALLELCEKLRGRGEELVITGDFNTAHKEIDLANPKANEKYSGFLPIEREWLDKLVRKGYVDTFRHLYPNKPDMYTWWTYRFNARKKNVGWRIDYFFVTEGLMDRVKESSILSDVYGSDHAPILLRIK
jgi:exodeoxyribonuclease III